LFYKEKVKGKYKVSIKQAVRETVNPGVELEGITDVGLRIEKIDYLWLRNKTTTKC
jgi:hypothetical protein